MSLLLAALAGTLVYLESWPIGQFMLGRPAILLPLLGWLVGLPLEGLWLGIVLELALIRTLPMGSTLPPDPALGAWVCRQSDLYHAAQSIFDPGLALLVLISLGLSWLAPWLTELQRRINGVIWHPRVEAAVLSGDDSRVDRLVPLAVIQTALLAFCCSLVILLLGQFTLPVMVDFVVANAPEAESRPAFPFVLLLLAWAGLWRHAGGRKGGKALLAGFGAGLGLVIAGALL
jgi:mannose/fructose/N-acetylgalactosamine-specific phosphotransferase system component IIC